MNSQESGSTECGPDKVPPIEVIPVEIDPGILDAIKRQIAERRPDLADELSRMPVDAFIALEGNRVIAVAPEGEQTFVPGPNDMFMPQSLIPIALFVGVGSGVAGCSVGSGTKYREY